MSDEFVEIEREWQRIVVQRDREAAERFLSDEFVLTSAGGIGSAVSKVEWLDALNRIETRAFSFEGVEARIFGETAVVRLTVHWDASIDGRSLTDEYAIVDVFVRRASQWQPTWRISQRLASS